MMGHLLTLFNTTGVGAGGVLNPPENLALSIMGAGLDVITAEWDAVAGATTYEIEYSDDGVTYTPVDTTALLTFDIEDTDYDPDAVTHYVRVRAVGGEDWAVATISGLLVNAFSRYSLDSTAWADSIGSATLSGASVTTTTGKLSNAADLSTANGLSSSDGIYNFTATPYAFLGWVKVDSAPDGFESPLQLSGADFPGAMLLRLFSGHIFIQSGGSATELVLSPVAGTWYCVAVGFDGTNMRGYANAVSVVSSAVSTAAGTGALALNGCNASNAALDELLFIRGRFPSEAQINEFYNGGTGKAYPYNP